MASPFDPSVLERPGPLIEGRMAVITVGGGGIGAATAALFALHGAHLVIADIDEALSAATVAQVSTDGPPPERCRWSPAGPLTKSE